MESHNLKNIVEAALLAAANPLTLDQLRTLFGEENPPEKQEIREVIEALRADYEGRGIEIADVASGYRVQVRAEMSPWLAKLWEERPPRYSRALVETLVIIAYRQPVTRGDVEEIRGVSVTTNIIRTLLERNWIKVVGHRDVPGKPAMFGTTREFLDYFNLKKLDDLPPLAELASMDPVSLQLELGAPGIPVTEEDQSSLSVDADSDNSLVEADADTDAVDVDPETFVAAAELDAVAGSADVDDDVEQDAETEAEQSFVEAEVATTEAAAVAEDDEPEAADLPPGAVRPLVALNAPGDEEMESASIAFLDDARVAASESKAAAEAEIDDDSALQDESPEVVPFKKS